MDVVLLHCVFLNEYSIEKKIKCIFSSHFCDFCLVFFQVEIKCLGQPVIPTLLLYNLVDMWLRTASKSERVPASIGSSAKDFVMVLAYARKVSNTE